jgi:hypothetical protein
VDRGSTRKRSRPHCDGDRPGERETRTRRIRGRKASAAFHAPVAKREGGGKGGAEGAGVPVRLAASARDGTERGVEIRFGYWRATRRITDKIFGTLSLSRTLSLLHTFKLLSHYFHATFTLPHYFHTTFTLLSHYFHTTFTLLSHYFHTTFTHTFTRAHILLSPTLALTSSHALPCSFGSRCSLTDFFRRSNSPYLVIRRNVVVRLTSPPRHHPNWVNHCAWIWWSVWRGIAKARRAMCAKSGSRR